MKRIALFSILCASHLGCSDPGGTTGSESHWLPCQKTDDCESDYICARNQCRPPDDLPEDWVGECDAATQDCGVVGSAPVNDPEAETTQWELRDGVADRPHSAGQCNIREAEWFFGPEGTIDFGDHGKPVRHARNGVERHFTYGPQGFISTIRIDENGTTTGGVTYSRDAIGRVLTKHTDDANGERLLTYTYDALGRIAHVRDESTRNGQTDVREVDVVWSADGLTHTDYNAFLYCEGDDATITRDADGFVRRRDWPTCAAFGNPMGEYERDGARLLRYLQLDRQTGESFAVAREATYDADGRVTSIAHMPSVADIPGEGSSRTEVTWANGWMSRLTIIRTHDDAVIDTVELDGECWFTVDELFEGTPQGTVLPLD